jgi:ADP-ribose pyrophosphatase YjhB (NUDIX family)
VNPAQQIALWADKLRDHAAQGLRFAANIYERDRWTQIQTLAMEMLALATGDAPAALEPLRATIFSHVTPFAVGDAAIIDDAGRMLLIQRADNGKWAMPGGAFEVGETPAQGAVREALEETGVYCEPIALAGVFDSRLHGAISRHHMVQFVFLCRPLGAPTLAQPSHSHEVLQTAWFAENELPADLDPGHAARIPVAFQVWRGAAQTFFDP